MLVSYAIGVGLKTHHVIIWGTVLVAGALPVWNGADPSNIGLVLAGVALDRHGVFDHRALRPDLRARRACARERRCREPRRSRSSTG